jgi:t-SNARE complex subunit (syntaxin)
VGHFALPALPLFPPPALTAQPAIDLIDENIAAAETRTKEGAQQLHKASEYHDSCSRKLMWIAACVALVVAVTVVVVLAAM